MYTCVKKFMTMMIIVLCVIFVAPATSVFAVSSLDGVNNAGSTSSGDTDNAVSNYLKGRSAVTDENMQKASVFASPIANFIGNCTGFVLICLSAGIFFITSLDLAYIAIPPLRDKLNPGQGGGTMPNMGGGMPMGGAPQSGKRRWVTEEAINAVNKASANQQGGGMPNMGGGMPMGGMPMGGMPMGGAPQQANGGSKPRSAIVDYLIHRTVFIVFFAVASVVLMSSILTDCGINLAALILKIMNLVSGNIGSIQI